MAAGIQPHSGYRDVHSSPEERQQDHRRAAIPLEPLYPKNQRTSSKQNRGRPPQLDTGIHSWLGRRRRASSSRILHQERKRWQLPHNSLWSHCRPRLSCVGRLGRTFRAIDDSLARDQAVARRWKLQPYDQTRNARSRYAARYSQEQWRTYLDDSKEWQGIQGFAEPCMEDLWHQRGDSLDVRCYAYSCAWWRED